MSEMTDSSNYGYTPSLSWSVAFITLFGVSALLHSYQAFRSKYWVAYPTLVLGCLIEIMGWSARLWSHENVLLLTPFLMQICTLIMAPVFFSAFDYIILGAAIRRLGPQYSVLRPGMYFAVFLTADLISLVLQAVGGGQASASAGTSAPTQSATDIMVAGIIFQLISMGVFVVLGFDFIVRATSGRAYVFRERQIAEKRARAAEEEEKKKKNDDNDEKVSRGPQATLTHVNSDETVVTTSTSTPTAAKKLDSTATSSSSSSSHAGPNPNPNPNPMKGEATAEEQVEARENLTRWWIMLGGCLVSSIAIVIRGIYRSIELSAGWDSTLMHTEILQAILDGLMMVIAVGIFNVLNPLYLLPKRASWKGFH